MARQTCYVGDLTIANGAAASNSLSVPQGKLSLGLIFVGPSALTNAVTIQVAMGAETPQALYEGTTAQVITAAGTKRVNFSGAQVVKLLSAANEGAQRVVPVYAEFDI